MTEQKLIITLSNKDKSNMDVKLSFEPGLPGYKTPEFDALSDDQRELMIAIQHIAKIVVQALKEEEKE